MVHDVAWWVAWWGSTSWTSPLWVKLALEVITADSLAFRRPAGVGHGRQRIAAAYILDLQEVGCLTAMTDLDDYDYELPRELIAQHALGRRSDARLMVVDRVGETIAHASIRDLPGLLDPHDCLVLNDTRVLAARLLGYRIQTGGRWSGLFVKSDERGNWEVLCKTRGRLAVGEEIMLQDRLSNDGFRLALLANLGDGIWAARPRLPGTPVELLQQVGRVPLPPYIRGGEMVEADIQRYQTVFARHPGRDCRAHGGASFHAGVAVATGRRRRRDLSCDVARRRGDLSPDRRRSSIEDHRDASRMGRNHRVGGPASCGVPRCREDGSLPWEQPVYGSWRRRPATGNSALAWRDRPLHTAARTRFRPSMPC